MTENAAQRQGTMRMIERLAIPSVLCLVAAAWFHEARGFSSTVRVAPLAITAPVLFLSIVVLVQEIVGVRQQRPTKSLVDSYLDTHQARGPERPAAAQLWFIAYCASVLLIGFVPGSLVWIAGFLRLDANQSWGFIILAGIFFFALFHLVLDRYLSLPMYPGMFSVPGLY